MNLNLKSKDKDKRRNFISLRILMDRRVRLDLLLHILLPRLLLRRHLRLLRSCRIRGRMLMFPRRRCRRRLHRRIRRVQCLRLGFRGWFLLLVVVRGLRRGINNSIHINHIHNIPLIHIHNSNNNSSITNTYHCLPRHIRWRLIIRVYIL